MVVVSMVMVTLEMKIALIRRITIHIQYDWEHIIVDTIRQHDEQRDKMQQGKIQLKAVMVVWCQRIMKMSRRTRTMVSPFWLLMTQ